ASARRGGRRAGGAVRRAGGRPPPAARPACDRNAPRLARPPAPVERARRSGAARAGLRQHVGERLVELDPTRPAGGRDELRRIAGAPVRSAWATRAARPGTRKRLDWPGPVWLNARTHTAGTPSRAKASSATASAAALLTPYGDSGRSGVRSSIGAAVPEAPYS